MTTKCLLIIIFVPRIRSDVPTQTGSSEGVYWFEKASKGTNHVITGGGKAGAGYRRGCKEFVKPGASGDEGEAGGTELS